MVKTCIKAGIGLFLLIIMISVAGVFFILKVDPNQYKPQIQQAVSDATGAELELASIEWDLWPNFQLQLHGLALNTTAQAHNTLLAVDLASVKVALMPLLTKKLVVDHFTLEKPSVWFYQDASGQHNWQPLLDQLQSDEAPTEQPTSTPPSDFTFAVNTLEIKQGLIDVTGVQTAQIQPLDLKIENIQFGEAIKIQLDALLKQLDQQLSVKLNTALTTNSDISQIELTNFDLKAQGQTAEQTAQLQGSTTIDLNTMATTANITVKPVNLDAWMNLAQTATAQAEQPDTTPTTDPTTDTSENPSEPTPLPLEMLRDLKLNATLMLEDVIFQQASHQLEFALKADQGVVALQDFSLNAYDGQATGGIQLNAAPSTATLEVDLEVVDMAIATIAQTWLGAQPLTGDINSSIAVQSSGNTIEALLDGLQGATKLTMANAILPKVDFHQLMMANLQQKQSGLFQRLDSLPSVKAALGTLKTPKVLRTTTELNQLLAQFDITPDAITSQTITATFDEQPIDAKIIYGRQNQALTLDTRLQLPFKDEQLAAIQWPVSCTGDITARFGCAVNATAIKPLLKTMAKQEARTAIKQKLAPVEDKAKQKVEKELGRSLNKLFNRN